MNYFHILIIKTFRSIKNANMDHEWLYSNYSTA